MNTRASLVCQAGFHRRLRRRPTAFERADAGSARQTRIELSGPDIDSDDLLPRRARKAGIVQPRSTRRVRATRPSRSSAKARRAAAAQPFTRHVGRPRNGAALRPSDRASPRDRPSEGPCQRDPPTPDQPGRDSRLGARALLRQKPRVDENNIPRRLSPLKTLLTSGNATLIVKQIPRWGRARVIAPHCSG